MRGVAISFVLNYEEGGERSTLDGDAVTEPNLHEIVGYLAVDGARCRNVESMFEYGSRAGFWRVHRLFTARGLPLTVYAVGQALERNPEAARAMAAAGWEVIGHGWRWIDYVELPEDVEREHIRRTNDTIERLTGQRPLGLYIGRMSERTRQDRSGGGPALRLGLGRRRAPLLDRGRWPAAPRRAVHARLQRLQVRARRVASPTARASTATWSTRSSSSTRRAPRRRG